MALCVTAYRCLHGLAPSYLSRQCIPVSDVSGRCHLRSASSGVDSVAHRIQVNPSNVSVARGSHVKLVCTTSCKAEEIEWIFYPGGGTDQINVYEWEAISRYVDGDRFKSEVQHSPDGSTNNVSLIISPVQMSDIGIYKCIEKISYYVSDSVYLYVYEETDTTVHQLTSSSLITSARNRPRTTTFFAGMATTEASTPIDGATRPDNHTAEEDLQPNNQTPVIQPLRLAQHPGPDDQMNTLFKSGAVGFVAAIFVVSIAVIVIVSWRKKQPNPLPEGGRADDNIYQKVIEDDNPWSLGNAYDDPPINHYAEISEYSDSDWHTYDRSLSYEPAHPVSFNVDED